MSLALFSRQFEEFFNSVDKKQTIFLTTFSFDETALLALLRRYPAVRPDQKIIVLHEVMRHKFPGLASSYYKNLKTVAVTHLIKGACPIFHPKLWMKVRGRTCEEMIVSSFNLSRYHLDDQGETVETLCHWKNLRIRLPAHPFFAMDHRSATSRLRIPPATIEVRLSSNRPFAIEVHRSSVSSRLGKMPELRNETLLRCCAPFCSDRALAALNIDGDLRIWDRGIVHGTPELHAKCLEYQRYAVLGSTNLTQQALHGVDGQARNTECFLLIRKTEPILSDLRKLLSTKGRALDPNNSREPEDGIADPDTREPGEPDDWKELKRLAVAAPRELRLAFIKGPSRRAPRIGLRIRRTIDSPTVSHIRLRGCDGAKPLTMSPTEARRIPKKHWQKLARIIVQAPVFVDGIRRGEVVWTRELDLGEFWLDMTDLHSSRAQVQEGSWRVKEQAEIDRELKERLIDVREVRDTLMTRESIAHLTEAEQRQRWLTDYTGYQVFMMPAWCVQLARRVRGGRS